jgi:Conjugative transposon protein TcpC
VASDVRAKPAGRRASSPTVGAALRAAGRVALWAVVALLLARGIGSVLSEPASEESSAAGSKGAVDPAASAFAVRFARLYLGDPSSPELASLFAPGAAPAFSASQGSGDPVAQAEVAGLRDLGGGQSLVTVACQLDDGRVLNLAVPIVRASAGEVAAAGAPAIVAGQAVAGAGIESPRPLAGSEAPAIAELVRRFLPAYFSAANAADLSYLLSPGAEVTPPAGGLDLLGVQSVKQLGLGEGPRRTVIAAARVRDPQSGTAYVLAYRLSVSRRGRWYVERVEGALS